MSTKRKSASTEKNPQIRKKTNPVKKTLTVIGTTFLSLVLILVITGSIVATALTVYVMKFMDNSQSDIDLYNLDVNTTSFMYAKDSKGEDVEIFRLSQDDYRIMATLDQIPQHVKDAFISTEDERFYEHDGVDFKRTFAAFANMILHFWNSEQGGSTITQQLVKNVTGDDEQSPSRKIREIFQAMNLERYYTKDDIFLAYLNYIGFGGNCYGVQAASNKYFGKDVSELTVAEAACLASIPKSPNTINPFAADTEKNPGGGQEANKNRRNNVVLPAMLKNGVISSDEYEAALAENIVFADEKAAQEAQKNAQASQNKQNRTWFVDMAINDVAADLKTYYGLDSLEEARTKLSNGGFKIYTTVDIDMQNKVEEKFKDTANFSQSVLTNPPQAAFICMDYDGNVKAVVGGVGEKPGALPFNRAVDSKRSIGSCIKPISTYSYGLSMDMYHWSTIFQDNPIEIKDYSTNKMIKWPKNYSNKWTGYSYFTFQALQRSLNTIPAQLCEKETPQAVFDFVEKNMKITSLVESDIDYSPMTVGGLTQGISLKELVSAYQAFGNAGKISEPTSYTKVVDSDGKVILEHEYFGDQALDEDTAYVMNKLMQTVIEGPNGTGKAAKLSKTALIGKTGTSQDWQDIAFVGCTPNYVSGLWYGYDDPYKKDENGNIIKDKNGNPVPNSTQNTYYSSAKVWKNVFGDIADNAPHKDFPSNDNVKALHYCTITGLIAGPNCPVSAEPGYYKPSNIPEICSGVHNKASTPLAPVGSQTAAQTTVTTSGGTQTSSETSASETTSETTIPVVIPQHTTS